MRRGNYAAIFVILLCALATASIECRNRVAQSFLNDGRGALKSPEIDQELAEQSWMHCRKELVKKTDGFSGFELYSPREGTADLKPTLLIRRKIHKAINVLPTQVKQSLLDCLRKESIGLDVSAKEAGLKHWFFKSVELLFGWPSAPRRYLAGMHHQQTEPTSDWHPSPLRSQIHARKPLSVQSPTPAPASLIDGESPASSQSPNSTSSPSPQHEDYKKPSFSPLTAERPSSPSPLPEDDYDLFGPALSFPDDPFWGIPPYPADNDSPPTGKKSEKKSDDNKMIIAVSVTAGLSFLLSASLFLIFCLLRRHKNKVGPGNGKRDDRPLLNLSDISNGSSPQSVNVVDSTNMEVRSSSASTTNPSMSKKFSMKNGNNEASSSSSEAASAAPVSLVKPPPGKSAPPPPPPPPPGPPLPPPTKESSLPSPAPPLKPPAPVPNPPPPLMPNRRRPSEGIEIDGDPGNTKAKLKPFFWDKVSANPDHKMVWHGINDGSFQFNEQMIESLFGLAPVNKNKKESSKEASAIDTSSQYVHIIDNRKAQNISIVLRALNLTQEEIIDALQEGNELPPELLQTLMKMAPTADEELRLRLYTGEISQLGPAEQFLKALVEIPFVYKRVETLNFMSSIQEEVSTTKESFKSLEVASIKLRNSRLFLKLLEAVLKTGNRMNVGTYRGGAQAFKLDTLLKLSDVKGTDGKTTLLHFVVQEIIRSEGIRAARAARQNQSVSSVRSDDLGDDSSPESSEHYRSLGLQAVSGVSDELQDVKKAAVLDADILTATVSKLNQSLTKTKDLLNKEIKSMEKECEFGRRLASFVERAEADITFLLEEEKRVMALVKSTADYFHGKAGMDEGLRLFAIVRDFLLMLDKVCKEVKDMAMKAHKAPRKEVPSPSSESQLASPDIRQKLFPAIADKRMDYSSSDDES
ncbi:hypothetical protein LWI29_037428 [Acer saccharum]|uniref:Formin-like protein n=1 Tax=Acer saccharum TaxID=4024 RepID=A0AA39SGM7_ACESA|nr:hypothetical protein LWI29_037428 [Acer saccharum]